MIESGITEICFVCLQMASTRLRSNSDAFKTLSDGQEAHWEVVERMLFIYAKLNPGIQYVQVCIICTDIHYVYVYVRQAKLKH